MSTKHPLRSTPAKNTQTNSLFTKGSTDWWVDPVTAYDSWLVAQGFKKSSATVYRVHWIRFLDWLSTQQISIAQVMPNSVATFLNGLDGVRRQQRIRYHRLIERAFDAIQSLPDDSDFTAAGWVNPARGVTLSEDNVWKGAPVNAPTAFFNEAERRLLINHANRVCSEASTSTNRKSASGRMYWRLVRDRAMAGLFLEVGLKVSEAIALSLDDVEYRLSGDTYIHINATNALPKRRLLVSVEAATWLNTWLEERSSEKTVGTQLFTATKRGEHMHSSTVARAMEALFEEAQLPAHIQHSITAQRLRNSYGAKLFEKGASLEEVAHQLGYVELISSERLYFAWREGEKRKGASKVGSLLSDPLNEQI